MEDRRITKNDMKILGAMIIWFLIVVTLTMLLSCSIQHKSTTELIVQPK